LTPAGSLRPWTFVTLNGLLYCTGIRVSEALALRIANGDLDDGLLIIRHAKFHKSPAVQLHPGVREQLTAYAERRRQYRHRLGSRGGLFVNEWRRPCSYPVVVAACPARGPSGGARPSRAPPA